MPKNKSQNMFSPLGSFIVAKPFTKKETEAIESRKTDIKLPEASEKKGRVVWAKVVAVGETYSIQVGDIILCSEYDSYEIRVEGEEYLTIKEEFVFTKFNK